MSNALARTMTRVRAALNHTVARQERTPDSSSVATHRTAGRRLWMRAVLNPATRTCGPVRSMETTVTDDTASPSAVLTHRVTV